MSRRSVWTALRRHGFRATRDGSAAERASPAPRFPHAGAGLRATWQLRRAACGALVAAAAVVAWAPAAGAGEPADLPRYEAPADVPPLPPPLAAEVERSIADILRAASPDDAEAAVRKLSGIGAGTIPRIAAALPAANWRARAALFRALAEMDAPSATPLLAAGSRDPSFAVREASVAGLGKTGDRTAAAAVVARTSAGDEPSWRVRAAAATAIRRVVLRNVADRAEVAPALVRMLGDFDPDVARAALLAAGPLALPEALPPVLEAFADGTRSAHDRRLALVALRAYRDPSAELLAALRRGFLQGTDAEEAVRAGRAILDLRGAAALGDADLAASVLRHLTDEASQDMRDALAALGPAASPWLAESARTAAHRVAAGREEPGESPFGVLLDTLLQVDEAAGLALLREVLTGPGADGLHRETRLFALRKAQFGLASKLGADLRALLASPAGRDVYADALRAVAASGGPDVGALVDAALRDPRPDVRAAAVDVLERFREIPTPSALAEIAASSERVRERVRTLTCLGRRDRAAASRIAVTLLSHPDPDLRAAAIGVVGATRDPAMAELLRKRLAEEDGRSSHAAPTGDTPPPPPAAVTQSDTAETEGRVRRELRSAIVGALRLVAGADARPDLLRAATGDRDARVREAALQALHGIATAEDAPGLVARAAEEQDDGVRAEIERLLATLDGSDAARGHFAAQVADAARRTGALRVLAEPRSRVVPGGLAEGLFDPAWRDDERLAALRILERAGRSPGVPELARLTGAAHTPDLAEEAFRVLAANPSPEALAVLERILREDPDPMRRALAARGVGDRGSEPVVPLLVQTLDVTRPLALAAVNRESPDVQLYRECAIALGRIGTETAVRALVEHLLDPALATAGGRRSVLSNGPFQPEGGATVGMIRTLVAAASLADDGPLAGVVAESLARRAADGSRWTLDSEYLDGVARYLSDPEAYGLPPRRRTAAALPVSLLAAEAPPRWTTLDTDSWKRASSELADQGRLAEALAVWESAVACAAVEDAARSPEELRVEEAATRSLRARAAHAAGRTDEALRIAATIREPDPADGDLAYAHGRCLVLLGRSGPEAAASLRHAAAIDARDANVQFFLAWVVQSADGAAKSLPHWAEAERIDTERAKDFSPTLLLESRRGRVHPWGHFPYWHARALAAAGRADAARAALETAIGRDDRFGARALADAAFASLPDLGDVVASALGRIREFPDR